MNLLKTKRLILLETPHERQTPTGKTRCVIVNAWMDSDVFPSLIVGTMLLVELPDGWLLSHLLIEDEGRRGGFATEIVEFYEDRLGTIAACWASDCGMAFAKKYIATHGRRPHWQVERDPAIEAAIEQYRKRSTDPYNKNPVRTRHRPERR